MYFRAESVDLATQMLDDTDFRLGQSLPVGKMKVGPADFSYKAQKDAPARTSGKDKKKIIKRTQKLNRYVYISATSYLSILTQRESMLADWDDDDPSTLQGTSSRWDKVVVLKHMFTLAELEVQE